MIKYLVRFSTGSDICPRCGNPTSFKALPPVGVINPSDNNVMLRDTEESARRATNAYIKYHSCICK